MRGPVVDPGDAVVEAALGLLLDEAHGRAQDLGEHAAAFQRAAGVGRKAVGGEELHPAQHRGDDEAGVVPAGPGPGPAWLAAGGSTAGGCCPPMHGSLSAKPGNQHGDVVAEPVLVGVEDHRPLRRVAVDARRDLRQRLSLLERIVRPAGLGEGSAAAEGSET